MKAIGLLVPIFLLGAIAAGDPAPLDENSTVDQILDVLHARGQGLKDFTGNVALTETDPLSGDVTVLSGQVAYQLLSDGQPRMRVNFDSRKVGDKVEKYRREFVLDKGWLIERDYKRELEVQRQVLKPGQKMNPLKLGEGPFPLPIGQPREDVLKMFDVKKIAPAKDDPADTVHVQLVPRPKSQFERKFKSIDVWIDRKTNFPRRIDTVNRNETEMRSTEMSNIKVNAGLKDSDFELEKIGDDWRRQSESME